MYLTDPLKFQQLISVTVNVTVYKGYILCILPWLLSFCAILFLDPNLTILLISYPFNASKLQRKKKKKIRRSVFMWASVTTKWIFVSDSRIVINKRIQFAVKNDTHTPTITQTMLSEQHTLLYFHYSHTSVKTIAVIWMSSWEADCVGVSVRLAGYTVLPVFTQFCQPPLI